MKRTMIMKKRLIILGAPGVGKGTQASRLGADYGWAHISTGDMLRDAVREETQLGCRAKTYMEKGELVPDELMIGLVGDRFKNRDCQKGFILDGFPRTVHQAEKLDDLLGELNMDLDDVVNIDVSSDEIVRRLSQRLVCAECGHVVTTADHLQEGNECPSCKGRLNRRKDDEPDTVRRRLEVYEKETRSLIRYYQEKSILRVVDGFGSMDEVYATILFSLGLTPVRP